MYVYYLLGQATHFNSMQALKSYYCRMYKENPLRFINLRTCYGHLIVREHLKTHIRTMYDFYPPKYFKPIRHYENSVEKVPQRSLCCLRAEKLDKMCV